MIRERRSFLHFLADIDATHSCALMLSAHVLIDTGGPSRAKIAGRALETWFLLALVTQMPGKGTAVHKGTPAVVSTVELFAWFRRLMRGSGRSSVLQGNLRKPNAGKINSCNRIFIVFVNQDMHYIYIMVISMEINRIIG